MLYQINKGKKKLDHDVYKLKIISGRIMTRSLSEFLKQYMTGHKTLRPVQTMQHVACNIVQHCCMQHVASFEHPVARCWMMLHDVAWSLNQIKLHATLCNIVQHRATGCSNDATRCIVWTPCCTMLDDVARCCMKFEPNHIESMPSAVPDKIVYTSPLPSPFNVGQSSVPVETR